MLSSRPVADSLGGLRYASLKQNEVHTMDTAIGEEIEIPVVARQLRVNPFQESRGRDSGNNDFRRPATKGRQQ